MSDKAVTHQFKNCTFDLRGAGYACVSRGDEFEIGHTGEGDRVLIYGDTLDFTGLHILGPVALADRIKAAVALECYAMTTERDALRGELARLTAERDRFEAALGRACLVGGTTYLLDRAEKAEAERDAALAKAFCMGRDAAAAIPADHAEYARKRLGATTNPQYASDWSIIVSRCDMIADAIRALTPPADLAAKIGGE